MGSRQPAQSDVTLLSDHDIYLFNEGSHFRLYDKLGAHPMRLNGVDGTHFAVWAPDAERVSVLGNFNDWDNSSHPLSPRAGSGIWEGFLPGLGKGELYKFHIRSRFKGYRVNKTDPFSIFNEVPPKTASIVWDLNYTWNDQEWIERRPERNGLDKPMAIYEIHLGSWRRRPEEGNRSLSYRELAEELPQYLNQLGFTHVEFLPIMDHPFFGS